MSEVKVNKISPRSGTAITLGDSGDTFTIPSGATLAIAGSVTGFTSAGIDDNATSVAITINSSEQVGIGTSAPDGQLHIVGSDTTDQVIIENTDGGVSSAPDLVLFRNSASPADNDVLGRIDFRGDNDAGQSVNYMLMYATATDVSDGTEDVKLDFEGMKAGSNAKLLTLSSSNIVINEDSNDLDFRVESNGNANMLFVDGGNDRVGIGISNPQNKLDISATTWDDGILIKNTGNFNTGIIADANRTSAGGGILNLQGRWNGTEVTSILLQAGSDTTNKDDGEIVFRTASAGTPNERMRILSDGKVGIGTTTPAGVVGTDKVLEIAGSANPGLVINDTGQAEKYAFHALATKLNMYYGTTAFFTFDASNSNTGIGEATPLGKLHVKSADSGASVNGVADELVLEGSGRSGMTILSGTSSIGTIGFGDSGNNIIGSINYNHDGNLLTFFTNDAERMRIDSSGSVYIGKTSGVVANVGHEFNASAYASHTVDGGVCLYLNRKSSDGTILELRKDNSSVGSINVRSSFGVYQFGSTGTGIGGTSSHAWLPMVNNARSDNTTSLGQASYRMTDIYATNGTIATSDQNEKQSIQSLTTAEMNVGKKLSSLIKTYKFNSSVEEKGDSARTHTGIIAQDVQQAFNDEGLDASKYGLWCSDTWSIDADGEEIENPEEVTENNPSKTKLGIRYEELLSFIQAYNDQKFTELEARITTLENN